MIFLKLFLLFIKKCQLVFLKILVKAGQIVFKVRLLTEAKPDLLRLCPVYADF